MAGETFAELRVMILHTLDSLEESQREQSKRLAEHDIDLAVIKAKATLLGAFAGVAINLIFQALKFFK